MRTNFGWTDVFLLAIASLFRGSKQKPHYYSEVTVTHNVQARTPGIHSANVRASPQYEP